MPSVIIQKGKAPGIDLADCHDQVARLLYAGFHQWIQSNGYEFEDVLHEVYRKILVSNVGKSPWTPQKSTFGHFVHLICRSALSNFHRKARRVAKRERQLLDGLGGWSCLLADDTSGPGVDPVRAFQSYILNGYRPKPRAPKGLVRLAAEITPLWCQGHTIREQSQMTDAPVHVVHGARQLVRDAARAYFQVA